MRGERDDSRLMPTSMWSDKYEGLAGPGAQYQYPEAYADKLQGKLLMVGGMLDTTCTPSNTFRMVEAFQKANKDFDLMLLPNLGHANSGYLTRRAWDYMVDHLLNTKPYKEFLLSTSEDLIEG